MADFFLQTCRAMAQSAHELAACSMFAQTAALTEVETGAKGAVYYLNLLREIAWRRLSPVSPAPRISCHKLREARCALFY